MIKNRAASLYLAVLLAILSYSAETRAAIYYVSTNGSDAAAGTNWVTAKQTIQSAVNLTTAGDTVIVSNGLYDTGGATIANLGSTLNNRVAITNAITVQSVNGPGVTIIKGSKSNPYARCAYVGENARLTGFTLTGGHTLFNGSSIDIDGGGAYCASGAVISNCTLSVNTSINRDAGGVYGGTLIDCALLGNDAWKWGGGAYNSALINCVLTTNKANEYGGGANSGTLIGCTLTGNTAGQWGGGVYQAAVSNCILSGNTAGYYGGGAYQGTLYNCIVSGNTANYGGGGAYQATLNNSKLSGNTVLSGNGGGSFEGTLNNCEVSGNTAESGGGVIQGSLYNCTVVGNTASSIGGGLYLGAAYNCIVYFNNAPSFPNYVSTYFSDTCTTPYAAYPNIITNDPQFVNAASSNFHLSAASPCIDTGNNANVVGSTDRDGNPRIYNAIVDMGAYEFQGASADSDGDGFSDAEEAIAGTNPGDSNNFWRVTGMPNSSSFQFSSVTGRLYAADYNVILLAIP